MKTLAPTLVVILAGSLNPFVQAAASVDTGMVRVSARDINSSEVEWTEQATNALTGEVTEQRRRYVAVGNGLNYRDESGVWRESQDLIEVQADGSAAALRGAWKARLAANLNTQGAISLTTVSNRVVRSHQIGLYYFSAESGRSVLIGRVKDTIAELHPPNQLVWRDCLEGEGVEADYRVTCTKAGMEADLILVRLPGPESFGFSDSEAVRLEWFTEFLDLGAPKKREILLKQETDPVKLAGMAEPDLIEEILDAGDLWFPTGQGFVLEGGEAPRSADVPAEIRLSNGRDADGLVVSKRLLEIEGRSVLVEALDWRDLEPKLAALEGIKSDVRQARSEPVQGRRLPAMRVAKATTPAKSVRMASAAYAPRGFVLDYVAVAGSGDYTFASGVTYYISSSGYFGGFVTFQPNCTIKFANNAYLVLYGEDIACLGTSGSYSVLTSKDDDLFGEPIPGSTATPTYAASQAIWIYYVSWSTTLSYLQIRWAKTGIQFDANPGVNPSHYVNGVKLQQSQTGIYANACAVSPSGTTKCGVTTPTTAVNGATFSGTITDDCAGDTDSDGLPDSWEVSNFGNITSQNGTGDPDGDGLTNLQEYQLGTNPNSANVDTDGDGLADGFDPNRTSANGPPTLSGQSLPKCPQ